MFIFAVKIHLKKAANFLASSIGYSYKRQTNYHQKQLKTNGKQYKFCFG